MNGQRPTLTVRATRVNPGDWLIDIEHWGQARCDERVVGSILNDAADALFGADEHHGPGPETASPSDGSSGHL